MFCLYMFIYVLYTQVLLILILKKAVFSDSNRIQTHNHLVHKRTLNYLAKLASLAKWLSFCL